MRLGNGFRRSISTQARATLGRERERVGASKARTLPIEPAIRLKKGGLKKFSGRCGNEIHTGTTELSFFRSNQGDHFKNLKPCPLMVYLYTLVQALIRSLYIIFKYVFCAPSPDLLNKLLLRVLRTQRTWMWRRTWTRLLNDQIAGCETLSAGRSTKTNK